MSRSNSHTRLASLFHAIPTSREQLAAQCWHQTQCAVMRETRTLLEADIRDGALLVEDVYVFRTQNDAALVTTQQTV